MFGGWLPSRVVGRVDKLTMHWQYLPMLVWCGQQHGVVIMETFLNHDSSPCGCNH